MLVAPYPFSELPSLDRAAARDATAWARSAALEAMVEGGQHAATWLGVPLEVRPARAALRGPADVATESPTVTLLHDAPAALVLERGLAALLLERTLGGDRELGSAGPLSEVELGVLTYAVARWLRGGGSPFRVTGAYAHPLAGFAQLGEDAVGWPLALRLGRTSGAATLFIPRDHGWSPRVSPPLHRALGGAPLIELAICAPPTELPAAALARLEAGDVVVSAGLDLDHLVLETAGRVALYRGRLDSDGSMEITEIVDGPAELAGDRPSVVVRTEQGETDAMNEPTLERLSDVPVALTVELARLSLPLREVAALAVGEIVRTQQPIAHQVVLRAGERVVARGELVEVDGELGVRIVEVSRTAAPPVEVERSM